MSDFMNRFFWYDYMASDADAAQHFYSEVVGWTIEDSGMPGGDYRLLKVGDHGVGGMMQSPDPGPGPVWLGYIQVADADAMSERIVAAGGTIQRLPADIAGVGRFAVVADPGGAVFALLAPTPHSDFPTLDPTATGAFSWHELYSTIGQEKAFIFYSGLFGWETIEAMDMGPMGIYRIFGKDGVQYGGMMDKPADMPVGKWGFYTNVDAIDSACARIEAKGGKLVMGPHQVPGGSWIVQAVDPQGAHFALVSERR